MPQEKTPLVSANRRAARRSAPLEISAIFRSRLILLCAPSLASSFAKLSARGETGARGAEKEPRRMRREKERQRSRRREGNICLRLQFNFCSKGIPVRSTLPDVLRAFSTFYSGGKILLVSESICFLRVNSFICNPIPRKGRDFMNLPCHMVQTRIWER